MFPFSLLEFVAQEDSMKVAKELLITIFPGYEPYVLTRYDVPTWTTVVGTTHYFPTGFKARSTGENTHLVL